MSSYSIYNWIDENVAVGDNRSNYTPFDIIVNLDYDNNGVQHHSIEVTCTGEKHIYRIGCYDSETENMTELIKAVMPELVQYYYMNPKIKILFHCRAGVSRSATMAIAFLCAAKNYYLRDAYNLVLSRRPVIKPNRGFMKSLINMFP